MHLYIRCTHKIKGIYKRKDAFVDELAISDDKATRKGVKSTTEWWKCHRYAFLGLFFKAAPSFFAVAQLIGQAAFFLVGLMEWKGSVQCPVRQSRQACSCRDHTL